MYCSNCGATLPAQAKFCPACGARTPAADQQQRRAPADDDSSINYQSRYFAIPAGDLPALLDQLIDWLRYKDFQYQRLQTEEGGTLLQVVKKGGWRKLLGMDTALNIVCTSTPDGLEVKIGAGRWLDKAVAGGVGMVLLWPLAVTAGIGAYEQMRLPEQVFELVERFEKR